MQITMVRGTTEVLPGLEQRNEDRGNTTARRLRIIILESDFLISSLFSSFVAAIRKPHCDIALQTIRKRNFLRFLNKNNKFTLEHLHIYNITMHNMIF